jgi:hypothetical protein
MCYGFNCDDNIKRRLIFEEIILTKVVDETTQLHNELANVQSVFKEVNSFPFLSFASFNVFFKFTQKTSNLMFIS